MIRNIVSFPRLCECHQGLVRVLATNFPCLTKTNPSVPKTFCTTSKCSNSNYSISDHAVVVDNFLVKKHSTSKFCCSKNTVYHQTRCQNGNGIAHRPTTQDPKFSSPFSILQPGGSRRCYSSSTTSVPEVEGTRPIQLWGHETEPFGTVNIDAPFNVVIKPLNPEKYPEMNRALVKLVVPNVEEDEARENSKLSQWLNLYEMETSVVNDQLNLTGKIPKEIFGDRTPELTCVVEIPIKFNINVKVTGDANVSVSNMESDDVFIRCQHGNCWLKSVKCGKVDVYCDTGSIESSGVLQGNIRLGCGGEGTLKAKRLQGQVISCRTVSGNIDIADIYAEETMISASNRTILNLGTCHGKTLVNINSGDINIKSVEGNLEAITQKGDVDVVLTNTKKKAYVCSKSGDVAIGLPNPADMDLDLMATGIQLTKDFAYLLDSLTETIDQNKNPLTALEKTIGKRGGSRVTGDAKYGILSIKYQDWLSSIGLKFSED